MSLLSFQALRDMLGLETKSHSGIMTPNYYNHQLHKNTTVSAPPPSPSNFFVSN